MNELEQKYDDEQKYRAYIFYSLVRKYRTGTPCDFKTVAAVAAHEFMSYNMPDIDQRNQMEIMREALSDFDIWRKMQVSK